MARRKTRIKRRNTARKPRYPAETIPLPHEETEYEQWKKSKEPDTPQGEVSRVLEDAKYRFLGSNMLKKVVGEKGKEKLEMRKFAKKRRAEIERKRRERVRRDADSLTPQDIQDLEDRRDAQKAASKGLANHYKRLSAQKKEARDLIGTKAKAHIALRERTNEFGTALRALDAQALVDQMPTKHDAAGNNTHPQHAANALHRAIHSPTPGVLLSNEAWGTTLSGATSQQGVEQTRGNIEDHISETAALLSELGFVEDQANVPNGQPRMSPALAIDSNRTSIFMSIPYDPTNPFHTHAAGALGNNGGAVPPTSIKLTVPLQFDFEHGVPLHSDYVRDLRNSAVAPGAEERLGMSVPLYDSQGDQILDYGGKPVLRQTTMTVPQNTSDYGELTLGVTY